MIDEIRIYGVVNGIMVFPCRSIYVMVQVQKLKSKFRNGTSDRLALKVARSHEEVLWIEIEIR